MFVPERRGQGDRADDGHLTLICATEHRCCARSTRRWPSHIRTARERRSLRPAAEEETWVATGEVDHVGGQTLQPSLLDRSCARVERVGRLLGVVNQRARLLRLPGCEGDRLGAGLEDDLSHASGLSIGLRLQLISGIGEERPGRSAS